MRECGGRRNNQGSRGDLGRFGKIWKCLKGFGRVSEQIIVQLFEQES